MGPVSISGQGIKIPEVVHDVSKKKKVWVPVWLYVLCKCYVFWEDNIGEIQNQVTDTDLYIALFS